VSADNVGLCQARLVVSELAVCDRAVAALVRGERVGERLVEVRGPHQDDLFLRCVGVQAIEVD